MLRGGNMEIIRVNNLVKYYYIELKKFRNQTPNMKEKLNQWIAFIDGERDDYITFYSQSKRTASLTIRCMPQVLITPQTADLEEQIAGFDFDFKIYFDCLDERFQIPSFLTISSYDPKNQTVFEKSSLVLKEL